MCGGTIPHSHTVFRVGRSKEHAERELMVEQRAQEMMAREAGRLGDEWPRPWMQSETRGKEGEAPCPTQRKLRGSHPVWNTDGTRRALGKAKGCLHTSPFILVCKDPLTVKAVKK